MNRQALWITVVGCVLIALAILVLFERVLGLPEVDVAQYRTETTVTVADGDRTASGKVHADCIYSRSHGWSTGTQSGVSASGMNPFVVLGDRSILVLSDLHRCPGTHAAVGSTYRFHPDGSPSPADEPRIDAPYAHAQRYDNIDDAKILTLYSQQVLFRGGIDGLRITDAKLVIAERKPKAPLPDLYGDAFPWYRNTPRGNVGTPEYGLHDFRSRFSGFIVRLNQLDEKQRCNKFDREAEGPLLVEGDRWDTCPPWGGENLGWLIARPNADLSRIDYSYNERSLEKIATHYRATWLEARGAPGANKVDDYFFWQPKLCFDGQCFATHAARHSAWAGFRLYYPKKNEVISVEWVH